MSVAAEDYMTPVGGLSLEPPPGDLTERSIREIGVINVDRELAPKLPDPNYEPYRAPLEAGSDGDDIGKQTKVKFRVDGNGDPERLLAQLAPADMLQSGHGFLIRDAGEPPKTIWRTSCEVCGSALPLPGAEGWVCEFGAQPGSADWDQCQCNWCLLRGQWLRTQYRPRGGRPAQRCGTAECTRYANRERKRKQRLNERQVAVAG